MNNLKKWISKLDSSDERIKQLDEKALASAGLFIFILAFLDSIIRGAILKRPFTEWGISISLFTLYLAFLFIKMLISGTLYSELENKELVRKNKKFNIRYSSFDSRRCRIYLL